MDPVMDPIPSHQTFPVLLAAGSGMSWDPTPARAVLHPICTYVQPGIPSCCFIRPDNLLIRPDHGEPTIEVLHSVLPMLWAPPGVPW
jgi:hypothetical protein